MTAGLAIALFIGQGDRVLGQGARGQNQNDPRAGQYGASPDARQHGYEHAYRDGADQGRQDRETGTGRNFNDNDYLSGAREYQPAFGNKVQYMSGYRDGYKAGYDDGYNDRGGRYGQLYGRPDANARVPAARADVSPTGSSGSRAGGSRAGGSADTAFDTGYRDGITSGQQDQGRNERSNFRGTDAYQKGDLGYRASYGDRNAYRLQFQDGFERGYQDGYGRSQYSTDGGGYFPTQGGAGAADTRDGQGTATRSFTVPGNRLWTPTNIRVNQGDRVRIEANGEIRFTSNAADRAGTAGSLAQKFTPGAPLPKAFVGALTGRIDNGRPFGIGDQTSLVMPASGILYLGINDDNVTDNSGQFQVTISW
jgi:hypothetical protein